MCVRKKLWLYLQNGFIIILMRTALEILKTLSIEEKIRLLNGVGSWNSYDAGGKIPVFSMSDGPHGLRYQGGKESYANINQSDVATCFPTASAIASSWDVDASQRMAAAISKEAKAFGVKIMLGCGMNIKRSPLCGRNFEYFSEDPLLSGELAASYVRGMQENGVGACIKHFALNNQEKFRQSSSSNVGERAMREIYLSAFERAVKKSQPLSIMCSYNMINGTYASAHKELLSDILRSDWGFGGIVISDWGADIDAVKSLRAGLDLAMPDSKNYFYRQIKAAYDKGLVKQSEIDEAALRIIEVALKLSRADAFASRGVDYSVQHNTAFELACESAVLLKNDGFFPIAPKKQKVLVVGELAQKMRFQGGGSSHITTAEYPCALDELCKVFDVVYVQGYVSTFCKESKKQKLNAKLRAEAQKKIRSVLEQNPDIPVLYFCGLEETCEGEGFDRDDMSLPQSHVDLYRDIEALTKNVGLVTFGGSPLDLTFTSGAKAVLHMYLCGEACGEACRALITGEKNPCGKLAETWPLQIECGLPSASLDVNYIEGILAGYRWYETKNSAVQYEFGYGLSYTSFEYSDLRVEKKSGGNGGDAVHFELSLDVENTGALGGSEVVQIYVENPLPPQGFVRPRIELRAFKKLYLEPGEKKRVCFELDARAFSVYSEKRHGFEVVGGEYKICAAASVRDIRLCQSVSVVGGALEELVQSDECVRKSAFVSREWHKKGEFTLTDSLGTMARESGFVRRLLKMFHLYILATSSSHTAEDPAVRIALSALEENPLESLISTSGGAVSEKFARFIVRKANR